MNLDILWDAADGDADFARDLAHQYLAQTAEQLELLRDALAHRSASGVERVAHACKGSSHTCGATTLASLLEKVEHLGHTGDFEPARRLLPELAREFARVQAVLSDLPSQHAIPEARP